MRRSVLVAQGSYEKDGGLFGLHGSCSGQAMGSPEAPAVSPLRAWRKGSLSHTLSAGLLQCGCSSNVSLTGAFEGVSAVLSTCPAGVKHLQYDLNLHGGVVQVRSPCL